MGHFAKVHLGKVQNVIVAEQDFIDVFVDSTPGDWIQCSYNTRGGVHYNPETQEPSVDQSKALRKNFPSKDWNYDKTLDAFIPPQPFPSWVLNEETCLWEAPITQPAGAHKWVEETQSWVPNT